MPDGLRWTRAAERRRRGFGQRLATACARQVTRPVRCARQRVPSRRSDTTGSGSCRRSADGLRDAPRAAGWAPAGVRLAAWIGP
jgi:hypothetical protein